MNHRRLQSMCQLVVLLAAALTAILTLVAGPAGSANAVSGTASGTLTATGITTSELTGPAAETRVGASTVAVASFVGAGGDIAAGQRLGNDPAAYDWALATGVAANGAADLTRALSYSTKIEGQMAARGWTQEAIQATVKNPEATHAVWDLTSGAKQAATAYVQRGGGYVVVNEEGGAIVQISNLNKVGWKVPWEDPRFIR